MAAVVKQGATVARVGDVEVGELRGGQVTIKALETAPPFLETCMEILTSTFSRAGNIFQRRNSSLMSTSIISTLSIRLSL